MSNSSRCVRPSIEGSRSSSIDRPCNRWNVRRTILQVVIVVWRENRSRASIWSGNTSRVYMLIGNCYLCMCSLGSTPRSFREIRDSEIFIDKFRSEHFNLKTRIWTSQSEYFHLKISFWTFEFENYNLEIRILKFQSEIELIWNKHLRLQFLDTAAWSARFLNIGIVMSTVRSFLFWEE